jgi:hypothetical protein
MKKIFFYEKCLNYAMTLEENQREDNEGFEMSRKKQGGYSDKSAIYFQNIFRNTISKISGLEYKFIT